MRQLVSVSTCSTTVVRRRTSPTFTPAFSALLRAMSHACGSVSEQATEGTARAHRRADLAFALPTTAVDSRSGQSGTARAQASGVAAGRQEVSLAKARPLASRSPAGGDFNRLTRAGGFFCQ